MIDKLIKWTCPRCGKENFYWVNESKTAPEYCPFCGTEPSKVYVEGRKVPGQPVPADRGGGEF